MKRGGELKRKTPLKSGGPIKKAAPRAREPRGTWATRKTGSTSDFTPEAKREITRRSRGWCEMPGCQRYGQHLHHRLMRSQGGMGTAENGMHVCRPHHEYIHAHPALAYEMGWLIRSGGAASVDSPTS